MANTKINDGTQDLRVKPKSGKTMGERYQSVKSTSCEKTVKTEKEKNTETLATISYI